MPSPPQVSSSPAMSSFAYSETSFCTSPGAMPYWTRGTRFAIQMLRWDSNLQLAWCCFDQLSDNFILTGQMLRHSLLLATI